MKVDERKIERHLLMLTSNQKVFDNLNIFNAANKMYQENNKVSKNIITNRCQGNYASEKSQNNKGNKAK